MTVEKNIPWNAAVSRYQKDYPDAFLLFRMGDFYELFYEDAVNAASNFRDFLNFTE